MRTPLHSASEAGATHCVNALIKSRANVEAADCEGNTPMHLALASDDSNDGVIAALKAAGCDMAAKNVHGLTCSEVEDVRRELAAEKVAMAARAKDDAREMKDKRKDEKMSQLRDFLETDAELDAPSIEALLVGGRLGSMDALVKLCDCDDRLRKVIKAPKVAKRLQAAVRAFVIMLRVLASSRHSHSDRQVRRYIKGFDSSDDDLTVPVEQTKSSGMGRSIVCVTWRATAALLMQGRRLPA